MIFRRVFPGAGADPAGVDFAGSASGPGGAPVAGLIRVAITRPAQPGVGQGPRQVARPLVATVLTTPLQARHVPRTRNGADIAVAFPVVGITGPTIYEGYSRLRCLRCLEGFACQR